MGEYRVVTEFFPGVAVVEDDDGQRILVLPDPRAPAFVFEEAWSLGIVAYVVGETRFAIRTPDHTLVSHFDGNEVEVGDLIEAPHPDPSFREMLELDWSPRGDPSTGRSEFVHLHCHSEYSPLDGLSKVDEIVERVVAHGQSAVAITDHGLCAAHPHLQQACDKAKIRPIFGIEAYLVDNRHARPAPLPKEADYIQDGVLHDEAYQSEKQRIETVNAGIRDYYHLILLAETDEGLRNIWAMSTEANREGFYGHPRMDWDTLERHAEGVIATTACLRGPLAHALLAEEYGYDVALANLGRLQRIFPGRLYIELHTNHLPAQIEANELLIDLASEYDVPLVAAVDSHYPCKDDRAAHACWLAARTGKTAEDDTDLFRGEQDYHLMDEAEVRAALGYLSKEAVDEAVANTVVVAGRCQARIAGKNEPPVFSTSNDPADDVDRLLRVCLANWSKTEGKQHSQEVYENRFEREMRLLIEKGFCGYFLMVEDQVAYAKRNGILVGPGRGSGGGCLVAYLAGITEIDPVEADLLFERFMTEGRTELPDFDVDYPSSKREFMAAYVTERWGADRVVRVGTHIRWKNKGAVRGLARVLAEQINDPRLWPDVENISKEIDAAEADKAGLGMPWEDLWAEHGEALQPYRDRYPTLFGFADRLVGRLHTYGKHAAGLVISTDEPLTGRLPLWWDEKAKQLVAEFDMDALAALGLIKFDLLNLRNLDTIQMCVDQVREQKDVTVNPYLWRDEYDDQAVWAKLGRGYTLGCFQIETRAGTRITKEFGPTSMRDLSDVITLVRPGPTRSGLRGMYFRRRDGKEPVSYPDPRLESVLAKTYGTILYQEDVMAVCMTLAGYTSTEADYVRKILGKKKIDLVVEEGKRFVSQAVERGMTVQAAGDLWVQMAEFARYSFNRAHAWGYAMLGYWTAYLKHHYPEQFFAALLSTEEKAMIPDCVTEARRVGITILPPDINESGVGFRVTPAGIRYGLDQIKGIGEAAIRSLCEQQPFASWDDFVARKGRAVNSGQVEILAQVGAFDSLVPNRRLLVETLTWEKSKESDYCHFRDERVSIGPTGLPCTFDWTTEPVEIGKSGKPLKPKPLPKKCSKACRQYVPRTGPAEAQPFTEADIMGLERELLGIHISATPFDRIPGDVLAECSTADEIEEGDEGEYTVVATVSKIKNHKDKHGRAMAFVSLFAQTSELDMVVFNETWEKYHRDIRQHSLVFAVVRKTDRGCHLKVLQPV